MFLRPKLKELIERIDNDASSRLPVAQLRRSNAKVFTKVLAGAFHSIYGFIEHMHRQQFFDTAEAPYLDRWASIYGLARKKAVKASGEVQFSFAGDAVIIPEGTILQSDDGVQYKTLEAKGNGKYKVEAIEPGSKGNQEDGDVLRLVSPVAGVYAEVLIGSISGGADAEDDASLRDRLLYRTREIPHGGTEADYVRWALEVPGVTRAWCNPLEDGAGSVAVRFVCDEDENIVPNEEMLRKVKTHIDTKRPVTAEVYVKAITLKPVNITIAELLPDTEEVKAAVERELRSLFAREAIPGYTIFLSHIRAAISSASGEEDNSLVAPTENPQASKTELLTLGEITWQ